jgi:type I restriction enzyme M protein
VEAMVAMPGQLFFNTQIPACLWFLVKQKTKRQGEVLFINARKLGTMISRVQIEFTDVDIPKIADTVHAWRIDDEADAPYADVPGFCRSVTLTEYCQRNHRTAFGRNIRVHIQIDGCPKRHPGGFGYPPKLFQLRFSV